MYECFIVPQPAAATWKQESDTPQPVSEYPGNNRQINIVILATCIYSILYRYDERSKRIRRGDRRQQ